MLILRELTDLDEAAFLAGLKEWAGEKLTWYSFVWDENMKFSTLLKILNEQKNGVNLTSNFVPNTMFYGFVDGKIVGRIHLRHELTEGLKRRGGHIGYAIAPKFRGCGYGLEMTRLVLPKAKEIGIARLLVTCADDNIPSWKIIESLGGKLEERVWDEQDKETIRKYWIDL